MLFLVQEQIIKRVPLLAYFRNSGKQNFISVIRGHLFLSVREPCQRTPPTPRVRPSPGYVYMIGLVFVDSFLQEKSMPLLKLKLTEDLKSNATDLIQDISYRQKYCH